MDDKAYVFHTTHGDMMNMEGAKCVVVGKDENTGMYRVKFVDLVLSVFPEELSEETVKEGE